MTTLSVYYYVYTAINLSKKMIFQHQKALNEWCEI